eukprot:TRINITY_DN4196_c0_g1_i2.p1 TRINITY_DN4196_c0_g1~~TRINITY_DN4196_c0_g1_i2.p1  ORF type:complete len:142 (+),score=30.91 TRINITY_DN4196_c0_g1_i2:377-802(+)
MVVGSHVSIISSLSIRSLSIIGSDLLVISGNVRIRIDIVTISLSMHVLIRIGLVIRIALVVVIVVLFHRICSIIRVSIPNPCFLGYCTVANGPVCYPRRQPRPPYSCLLYTSDAADEEDSVDLGGRRIIKKKKKKIIKKRI